MSKLKMKTMGQNWRKNLSIAMEILENKTVFVDVIG